MAERSLRMRQARGSMPLSSTRATLVAHEHEPPVPGLVSSVGRAHDSYDLRRSHERRRLLRSCGRGFNPRIGCKEFSSWLCGPTTLHEQSAEKECPADPGSSPGEGDDKYTAAVPRSLGGQDSRFSLSQLCVAHTRHAHTHLFRKEASTPGFTFDWVRLPACDYYHLCSYGLVGHNVRLTRGRSRVRTPV